MVKQGKDTNTPDWARHGERGSRWIFKPLVTLYRLFGRRLVEPAIYPFVTYFFATDPDRRRAIHEYLRRLYRHAEELDTLEGTPSLWDVYKLYLEFGHVVFDRVALWIGLRDTYEVSFPDRRRFLEYLRADHGAILLSFHVGSFGLMRYAAHSKDVTVNVLAYWENSPVLNRLLGDFNPSAFLNVIRMDPSNPEHVLELKDRVEAGEFIAILGDRLSMGARSRDVECSFLGETARFPAGPYLLAHLLDCPMLLTYCVRTGHHSYEVHAEDFAESVDLPRDQRDGALRKYVLKYARRLEEICRKHPYQWFNFYDFWS